MRVYSSWPLNRSASLLTSTVLIWFGVLLSCWAASGSEVSTAFTMADAPHAQQAANGYGYWIDGNNLAVYAEDDEAGDRLPKNAAFLRTLVFVLYFGLALGWIAVSGWRRRRPEVCSLFRCCFHSTVHLHQRRLIATLLEVFRL